MKTISVGDQRLSVLDVYKVAHSTNVQLKLSPKAKSKIEAAHKFILKKAKSGEVIYGVNTGFGILSSVKIDEADLDQLQLNILRSHAAGVGDSLPKHLVRTMVFLRAMTLTQGHSGVSVDTVEALLELLNHDVTR